MNSPYTIKRVTLAALLVTLALGCGGSSDDKEGDINTHSVITGRLGAGFTTPNSQALSASVVVDEIWALPLRGASLNHRDFATAIRGITFDADGNFSFQPEDVDYLLVLVHTPSCYEPSGTAAGVQDIDTRLGCIRGYVTLAGADGSTLTAIPTSSQVGDLNLGELTYVPPAPPVEEGTEEPEAPLPMPGDAVAETTLEEAAPSFAVELGGLTTIDDLLRGAVYKFANFDDDMKGWDMIISYNWRTPVGTLLSAESDFSSAQGLSYFHYHYYLFSNIAPASLLAGVTNTPGYLKVTPPAELTMAAPPRSSIAGPTQPISVDAQLCYIAGDDFRYDLPLAVSGITAPGMWLASVQDQVVAKFDLSSGAPFQRGVDGSLDMNRPIMLYPSIKADVSEGRIHKLWFKWLQQNGGVWQAVDPLVAMKSLSAVALRLSFANEAGDFCTEDVRVDNSDDTEVVDGVIGVPLAGADGDRAWTFNANSESDCYLQSVQVGYDVSGVTYDIWLY